MNIEFNKYFKEPIVIVLVGYQGCGKSTIAELLLKYDFKEFSFADSLKKCVSIIFGWSVESLRGNTPQSREWREKVDNRWSEDLNRPGFTPRIAMREFGNDVMKEHFNNEIWVLSLKRKIDNYIQKCFKKNKQARIVISDCRFPIELEKMIHYYKAISIRIDRKLAIPYWLDEYNKYCNHLNHNEEEFKISCPKKIYEINSNIHPSESSLIRYECKYTIENNSTINELKIKIREIVSNITKLNTIRIGIDIDDTIFSFNREFIQFACHYLDKNFNVLLEKNGNQYNRNTQLKLLNENIHETLNITKEECQQIHQEFYLSEEFKHLHGSDIFDYNNVNVSLMKENYRKQERLLQCIKNDNNIMDIEFFLITARDINLDKITKDFISIYYPGIFNDNILYANYYDNTREIIKKSQLCKDNLIDMLIDDRPMIYYELQSNYPECIVLIYTGYIEYKRKEEDKYINYINREQIYKHIKDIKNKRTIK